MEEKNKHYIVYQITNKINNKIYIGAHITENINDGYFGSGINIKRSIKKFGKENFEKIILYNLLSKEEMLEKERELVNNEFIKRGDTYNIILGGGKISTDNMVVVKDRDNNNLIVHKTDPRYLSGELISVVKDMIIVKDVDDNYHYIHKTDPRYLSGELVGVTKNMVTVKDKDNKTMMVSVNDSKYLSGELVSINKNMIVVKDKNGNKFSVHRNDPRYLSGELVSFWIGKTHTHKSKDKMRNAKKGKYKGEENSQFGTCWIYNTNLKLCKKIKKDELDIWLNKNWIKGRKINF
jgi:hypothetical protein